jgi:hypothetical protein
MSNTVGVTQPLPSAGARQMPTLIPPVASAMPGFAWSWYCQRASSGGCQQFGHGAGGGQLGQARSAGIERA